ncbi:CRAL-TRIO domain-containing protein [Chytriomyces cf. hyalinus JEL632]|nr:CRAL-TRIO domain-containing protein [Chytriomyces cf. hyalinus JEL632]
MFSRKSTSTAQPPSSQPPILSPPTAYNPPADYPLTGFTAEQKAQFDTLTAHVANLLQHELTGVPLDGEIEWANDECVVRYLKAAKFDGERAAAMIEKTLQWRRDYRPTEISFDEMEPEAENGKAFFNGFDRNHRPVFILNSGITYSKDPERYNRYILFNLERGLALCPRGVSQVCAIANVDGVTMFNQNPMSGTFKLADIFQNHYPERLGWICVMNPQWYIWVLSKVILPFIDPVTKAKVNFCYTKSAKKSEPKLDEAASEGTAGTGGWVENLNHVMDPEQLTIALGGNYDYTYDHKVYWPALKKAVLKN